MIEKKQININAPISEQTGDTLLHLACFYSYYNVTRTLIEKFNADIHLLPFLQLEISSTLVRERLAHKNSVKYLVPDNVIAYIKEKGLYGF